MKYQPLTTGLLLSAVAMLQTGTFSSPAQAQASTFFCGVSNGAPATMARTPRGDVPVIRWVSNYFTDSGYSPQRRCEEVSQRFQTFLQGGNLNYMTTGRMNGMNVVCVSEQNGGSCAGLLFTLKNTSNPGRTLQELMAVRVGAAGPLNETAARVYIDMKEYLQKAPVEGGAAMKPTSPTQVTAPASVPSTPAPRSSGGGLW